MNPQDLPLMTFPEEVPPQGEVNSDLPLMTFPEEESAAPASPGGIYEAMYAEDPEAVEEEVDTDPTFWENLATGTGQVVGGLGATARRLGAENLGESIEDASGYKDTESSGAKFINSGGEGFNWDYFGDAVAEQLPQIGGTIASAAGGAKAGAAIGALAGPAGMAVGGTAGAVIGPMLYMGAQLWGNLIDERVQERAEQTGQPPGDALPEDYAAATATALASGAFESIAGKFLPGGGKEGAKLIKRAVEGMVTEAGTEVAQGYTEQLGTQYGIAPEIDFEHKEAIGGGIIGAGAGGATGAIFGKRPVSTDNKDKETDGVVGDAEAAAVAALEGEAEPEYEDLPPEAQTATAADELRTLDEARRTRNLAEAEAKPEVPPTEPAAEAAPEPEVAPGPAPEPEVAPEPEAASGPAPVSPEAEEEARRASEEAAILDELLRAFSEGTEEQKLTAFQQAEVTLGPEGADRLLAETEKRVRPILAARRRRERMLPKQQAEQVTPVQEEVIPAPTPEPVVQPEFPVTEAAPEPTAKVSTKRSKLKLPKDQKVEQPAPAPAPAPVAEKPKGKLSLKKAKPAAPTEVTTKSGQEFTPVWQARSRQQQYATQEKHSHADMVSHLNDQGATVQQAVLELKAKGVSKQTLAKAESLSKTVVGAKYAKTKKADIQKRIDELNEVIEDLDQAEADVAAGRVARPRRKAAETGRAAAGSNRQLAAEDIKLAEMEENLRKAKQTLKDLGTAVPDSKAKQERLAQTRATAEQTVAELEKAVPQRREEVRARLAEQAKAAETETAETGVDYVAEFTKVVNTFPPRAKLAALKGLKDLKKQHPDWSAYEVAKKAYGDVMLVLEKQDAQYASSQSQLARAAETKSVVGGKRGSDTRLQSWMEGDVVTNKGVAEAATDSDELDTGDVNLSRQYKQEFKSERHTQNRILDRKNKAAKYLKALRDRIGAAVAVQKAVYEGLYVNTDYGQAIFDAYQQAEDAGQDLVLPADRVLPMMMDAFKNHPLGAILSHLHGLNLPVDRFIFSTDTKENAAYRPSYMKDQNGKHVRPSDTIYLPLHLKADGTPDGAAMLREVAHEYVHAGTVYALRVDPGFKQQMIDLYRWTSKQLRAEGLNPKDVYGIKNVEEFIAEAFTQPEFQGILASMEAPPQFRVRGLKSIWDAFVRAIRNLFPGSVDNSVLESVVAATQYGVKDGDTLQRGFRRGLFEDVYDKHAPPLRAQRNQQRVSEEMQRTIIGDSRWWSTVKDKKNRVGMKLSTLDQNVRRYTPLLGKAVRKYADAVRKKVTDARLRQERADLINRAWAKFEKNKKKAKEMSELMRDSTLGEFHPDLAWNNPANQHLHTKAKTKQGQDTIRKQFDAARKKFNDLGPDGRRVYRETKKFFAEQRADMVKAMLTRIKKRNKLSDKEMTILKGATSKADLAVVRDKNLGGLNRLGDDLDSIHDAIQEAQRVNSVRGPYFPLRRYGDHVLDMELRGKLSKGYATRELALDAARVMAGTDPTYDFVIKTSTDAAGDKQYHYEPRRRLVEFYENRADAEVAAQERAKEGYAPTGDLAVTRKRGSKIVHGQSLSALAGALKSKVGSEQEAAAIDTALLELLATTSIKAGELHRKGRAGVDVGDMRRAFASHAYSGSWAISDLIHGVAHEDALKGLRRMAAGEGEDGAPVSATKAEHAANFLRWAEWADNKAVEDRSIGNIEAAIGRVGFIWYLSSLSYSTVNATQPWLVGAPYLGARYGIGATLHEMGRLSRQVYGSGFKELMSQPKFGFSTEADTSSFARGLAKLLTGTEGNEAGLATALKKLTDLGVIDATFAAELYRTAKGGSENEMLMVLENGLRTLPQIVEVSNRIIMATAAYNLEMRKSGDAKAAYEAAYEAVLQTQFDYSDINKPLWFKGFPAARSIMMFKMYLQGIYALHLSSLGMAVGKNQSLQTRMEGAKTLGMLAAAHSMLAGVGGGLFEPFKMLIEAIANQFDDDDEVDFDLDNWLQNNAGEIWAKGLPRAAGFDMSSRVGIDNLLIWSQGQPAETLEESFKNKLVELAGPMWGGFGKNFFAGLDQMLEGQVTRGAGRMLPKGIADLVRAYDMKVNGVTTRSGEAIVSPDDIGWGAAFTQAYGFQPAAKVQATDRYYGQKGYDIAKKAARTALMRQYQRGDASSEDIVDWNRRNPEYEIKARQLIDAEKRRAENEYRNRVGQTGRTQAARDYANF